MVDLAYVGTKALVSLGYYVVKGTYNTVAYLTGNEPIVEKTTDKEVLLLEEIKNLRTEMDSLRKEIKQIHDDSFLLVDKHDETRIVACLDDEANSLDDPDALKNVTL